MHIQIHCLKTNSMILFSFFTMWDCDLFAGFMFVLCLKLNDCISFKTSPIWCFIISCVCRRSSEHENGTTKTTTTKKNNVCKNKRRKTSKRPTNTNTKSIKRAKEITWKERKQISCDGSKFTHTHKQQSHSRLSHIDFVWRNHTKSAWALKLPRDQYYRIEQANIYV